MLLRVREFRHKAGLTQRALARESSCSREMISAIENGRHEPKVTRLKLIAKALHLPIWTLLIADLPEEGRRRSELCP